MGHNPVSTSLPTALIITSAKILLPLITQSRSYQIEYLSIPVVLNPGQRIVQVLNYPSSVGWLDIMKCLCLVETDM
jgi:hypothetical protein